MSTPINVQIGGSPATKFIQAAAAPAVLVVQTEITTASEFSAAFSIDFQ